MQSIDVCRYMKDAYKMNPVVPKYNLTWDTATVSHYLTNVFSDNLCDLSKKLQPFTRYLRLTLVFM